MLTSIRDFQSVDKVLPKKKHLLIAEQNQNEIPEFLRIFLSEATGSLSPSSPSRV